MSCRVPVELDDHADGSRVAHGGKALIDAGAPAGQRAPRTAPSETVYVLATDFPLPPAYRWQSALGRAEIARGLSHVRRVQP